jgi:beta-lactamase regulating signal transducer with metallopeptidase domain
MLLEWMAYSLLLGVIIYGAGIVAERVAATWSLARRVVWMTAIVLSTVLPVFLSTRPNASDGPSAASAAMSNTTDAVDVSIAASGLRRTSSWSAMRSSARRATAAADPYLRRGWLGLSLVCLLVLVRAAVALRRQRVRWPAAEVDGVRVLVAPNTGPAVVGVIAPSIVVPQWALALDDRARRLMLRHEIEHVRARDPALLFAAAIAVTLFPWNAVLWLVARRLGLAVEIDCDQRVLAATSAQHEYGLLLLTVGARRRAGMPFAASLAERRSFLERRIKAMTTTPTHPRLVSSACIALLLAAATGAVRVPRPNSLRVSGERPSTPAARSTLPVPPSPTLADTPLHSVSTAREQTPAVPPRKPSVSPVKVAPATVTAASRGPDSLSVAEIRAMIAAHNPSALTGDPNANTITLVVDARMNYVVSIAESREIRPYLTEMPRGRGRGGSVGPDGPAGVGGRGGRARGSITGDANTQTDSARATQLADLKARVGELADLKARVENGIRGDTMILAGDVYMHRDPNAGIRTPEITAADVKHLSNVLGMNVEALRTFVDLQNVESVRGRTYPAGELGSTALRVFVVRLMP